MNYCPLISYQKQYQFDTDCMGEGCTLWSMNKDCCLIRLALLKYTHDMSSGREDIAEDRIKRLENQIKAAVSLGFPLYDIGDIGGGGRIEKD